ncbi:MAG: hypothetical protein NT138_01170 [Planctomycetales bacterium]|nr:hypothetical protein [Planctomycetales bacterium]
MPEKSVRRGQEPEDRMSNEVSSRERQVINVTATLCDIFCHRLFDDQRAASATLRRSTQLSRVAVFIRLLTEKAPPTNARFPTSGNAKSMGGESKNPDFSGVFVSLRDAKAYPKELRNRGLSVRALPGAFKKASVLPLQTVALAFFVSAVSPANVTTGFSDFLVIH